VRSSQSGSFWAVVGLLGRLPLRPVSPYYSIKRSEGAKAPGYPFQVLGGNTAMFCFFHHSSAACGLSTPIPGALVRSHPPGQSPALQNGPSL
jgi:hypothetical protein